MASLRIAIEHTKDEVVSELISAVESGEYDAVKSILQGQGHNFPVKDIMNICHRGKCPLHTAVKCGDVSIVQILLEHNASVNQTNHIGQSALHLCCNQIIWQHSFDPRQLEIVEVLIKYKADVNIQDKKGWTPLHECVYLATRHDMLRILLDNSASVNIPNNSGDSPLHRAARCGDIRSVQMLLENKASVNQTNRDGQSALHECVQISWSGSFSKISEIMNILISHKADVNLQDKYAVLGARKSKAGVLLEHHLNIWSDCKLDGVGDSFRNGNGSSSLDILLAWKNEFDNHFESFDTMYIVKLIQFTGGILLEQFVTISNDFLSMLIELIMKLYKRNRHLADTSKNEEMLAKELLQQLLDSEEDGKPVPLQHRITELNFSFPEIEREINECVPDIPCDYELMILLLESRIQINAVDCYGNTMLHRTVYCFMDFFNDGDKWYQFIECKFSQEVTDQLIETITLLLDKGVYPNAQNKHYQTARDILGYRFHDDGDDDDESDNEYGYIKGLEISRRIDDLLKQYEEIHSLTLKHMAAVVVKKSKIPYRGLLPNSLVKFVDLHRYLYYET